LPKYPSQFVNGDIYLKDLGTGEEVQLTEFDDMELRPKVDNGRVFYRRGTGKGLAVFMIDLDQVLEK
jgi:hypothetical protein